jgi:hypothetical protein
VKRNPAWTQAAKYLQAAQEAEKAGVEHSETEVATHDVCHGVMIGQKREKQE